MTNGILRSVRFAFVTLLLGLTVFTVAEAALGSGHVRAQAAIEGLSTCGSEAQPCALDAVSVVVAPAPAPAHLASDEGLAECGSEQEPCVLSPIAVEAERETVRLVSADRFPRMMLRAGS